MSKKDGSLSLEQQIIYQETIDATPSVPTALDTSAGLSGGFLIWINAGITLTADNRIDLVAKVGPTAAAATTNIVSNQVGGGVTIAGGIIASAQDAATAAAGYWIPYVGDPAFVTILPTFVGTHGTASEVCIAYVALDLENK